MVVLLCVRHAGLQLKLHGQCLWAYAWLDHLPTCFTLTVHQRGNNSLVVDLVQKHSPVNTSKQLTTRTYKGHDTRPSNANARRQQPSTEIKTEIKREGKWCTKWVASKLHQPAAEATTCNSTTATTSRKASSLAIQPWCRDVTTKAGSWHSGGEWTHLQSFVQT